MAFTFKKERRDLEPCMYWKKYEKGIDYITRKRLVERTNRNWNFFIGKQWEGLESGGIEMPFFNFIKPGITRIVTTIYTNRMAVHYTDMEGRSDFQKIYERLSMKFSEDWERAKQDVEMRLTLKDAAISGDGIQYFGTGDISDMQRISNTSVLYGDESEPDIQKQPYIIIHQRESVRDIRKQAEMNGLDPEDISLIIPDQQTEYMIGNRQEVEEDTNSEGSKVTTLIYMEKIDGIVNVAKCTKNVVYEPLHAIMGKPSVNDQKTGKTEGRGLTLYPLVKMSWERFPNDARGVSMVEPMIPNQIEINKTIARRAMTTKNTAYPKLAYDVNAVTNPEALTEVGTPIEVSGGGLQSVNQMVTYIPPAQSNDEPKKLTDDLLEISQDLAGAGETTMGNIDLNRVAASAIEAVNAKAESMHDEIVANFEMAVEDLANLCVELWQVYSPNGMTIVTKQPQTMPVIDQTTGQIAIDPMTGLPQMETNEVEIVEEISKEELDQIKPRTRIDVSKENSFTQASEMQFLQSLLSNEQITLEEFIELIPEGQPVPKQAMKVMFEKRKAQQQMQQQIQIMQQQQIAQQSTPEGRATSAWEEMDASEQSSVEDRAVAQWEAADNG